MADESVTLLFVTHLTATAKDFCSKGIVLQKGTLKFHGDIDDDINYYEGMDN